MKKVFIFCVVAFGLCANQLAVASHSTADKKDLFAVNTTNTEEIIALGTEPFWSVTVNKNGIVYSSPENRKLSFPYVTPLKAAGRPPDLLRVYRLRSKANSNLLIIKKVNSCSDGMSDKNYPYSATLILGDTVLEGCAENK
ncbi:MAG: hypothetical protein N2235_14675 [Fischerella sp.]|nr:hypothetical protein [Fischerella sp.]